MLTYAHRWTGGPSSIYSGTEPAAAVGVPDGGSTADGMYKNGPFVAADAAGVNILTAKVLSATAERRVATAVATVVST